MSLVCVCKGILSLVLGSPSISQPSRNEKTPRRICWSIEAVFQRKVEKRWVFVTVKRSEPWGKLSGLHALPGITSRMRMQQMQIFLPSASTDSTNNSNNTSKKRREASRKHQLYGHLLQWVLTFACANSMWQKNTWLHPHRIYGPSFIMLYLVFICHMYGHEVPTILQSGLIPFWSLTWASARPLSLYELQTVFFHLSIWTSRCPCNQQDCDCFDCCDMFWCSLTSSIFSAESTVLSPNRFAVASLFHLAVREVVCSARALAFLFWVVWKALNPCHLSKQYINQTSC